MSREIITKISVDRESFRFAEGGITTDPNSKRHRIEDLVSALYPAGEVREASDDRTDRWSGTKGEEVSIEQLGEREDMIQRGLDQQVAEENLFDEPESQRRRGLMPCQRVGLND